MSIVLITGITSFLGAHVALRFLEAGWTVHGTLRSDSKRPSLESSPFLSPYVQSGKLKLFVTGPLEDGHYDEAVKGCTAVVHVASPVEFDGKDFRKDYLAPAVQGTRSVVEVAARTESVKSVVVTSTYGAVGQHRTGATEQVGDVITEEHWNPYTLEELDEMSKTGGEGNGTFPAGYLYYMGAKKYAELAAWDVQKASERPFTLAAMNCVMIFGPPIQPLTSLSKGGMSTEWVYHHASTSKETAPYETPFPYFVDVRDAAEAHYQAITRGSQGRFILSSGAFDSQQISDIARAKYPERAEKIPDGTPGKYLFENPGVYTLDSSKSKKELGITYRPFETTVSDAFERFFALEKEGLK